MTEEKLVEEILEIASELDRGDITFDEAQIKSQTLVRIDRYEQLIIPDVSHQRELLIAYTEKLNSGELNYIHKDNLKVDTFLSNL